jgi:hypothetical protein
MFSSLSKFKSIPSTSTPLFTNPDVELFPSDTHAGSETYACSSSELPTSSDVQPTPDDVVPTVDPERIRNPPPHLCDYHCYSTTLHYHEPQSYKEASTNSHWQQAMQEELHALEKTHTWDLVDPPFDKTLVGCKWVYKIKTNSDGSIECYKARLVAKWFTQEYGIDYEETFAHVARITSVRTFLAIATTRKWRLTQMDVKNAFLNGELEEEVYMRPPPGYNCQENKVCRLRKALYGLKQAPRAWFSKFHRTITQLNFTSSAHDSALFTWKTDHGTVVLLLYVDDMIITGDDSWN